jgi:tetratricopeptide (TPR) repeat protein
MSHTFRIIVTGEAVTGEAVRARITAVDGAHRVDGPAPDLPAIQKNLGKQLRQHELYSAADGRFRLPAAMARQAGLDLAEALPAAVREALATALGRQPVSRLDVVIELEPESPFHALPWELLRLPGDDLPVALRDPVAFYRRVDSARGSFERGGLPLRILYAVAAPDRQAHDLRGALDWEREENLIAEAVDQALNDVTFETADEGNVDYLLDVAATLKPHILHLSGHGSRDALQLEDELGGQKLLDPKGFEELLGKLPDPTRLVILSQCLSAASADEEEDDDSGTGPFAHFTALAARLRGYGVGMQFPVSDAAATDWAAGFYGDLKTGNFTDLPRAVAAGRRRVFKNNQELVAKRPGIPGLDRSDWAAPVLYVSGDAFALVDDKHEAGQRPSAPPSLSDIDKYRDRRAFVGRRRERRQLLRAVRKTHVSGIVLRAIGGTGKSTLAAHLIERLAAVEGREPIYLSGRLDIAGAVGIVADRIENCLDSATKEARRAIRKEVRGLLQQIKDDVGEDELLDGLCDLLASVRDASVRLVLAFDDFEQNQLAEGATVPDDPAAPKIDAPGVGELMRRLARLATRREENPLLLLLTCRFAVPPPEGVAKERWRNVPVGPLGVGEQRKLWRRLRISNVDAEEVRDRLGGHPRAIEILALLEAWAAGEDKLAERLEGYLGVELTESLRDRQQDKDPITASVDAALEDTGLNPLFGRLRPAERDVVKGLARFRVPFLPAACPAVLRAVQTTDVATKSLWDRLTTFGLVAPARHDTRQADGDVGEELWQVPRLVREGLGSLGEPRSAVDAAAARHLRMRLDSETLGFSEGLELAEAVVEHGLDGGEAELASAAALDVLTSLYDVGEWRLAKEIGERWVQRAEEIQGEGRVYFVASVVFRLARVQRLLGEPGKAKELLEKTLADLRSTVSHEKSQLAISWVLTELANVEDLEGRYDDAREHLSESIKIFKQLGDQQGYSASLHQLAILDS